MILKLTIRLTGYKTVNKICKVVKAKAYCWAVFFVEDFGQAITKSILNSYIQVTY